MKGRTLPGVAFRPYPAPHQLRQITADGKSKARSAIVACGRRIDLAERLKQPVHPFLWNPNSGIGDGEMNYIESGIDFFGLHGDENVALRSEFHRITDEVHQNLPQASGIAH